MGGSKGSEVQYTYFILQEQVLYLDIALGMKAISSIAPENAVSSYVSFEPSFDAKIDDARMYAINIVGLNTFTCGIEYCLNSIIWLYCRVTYCCRCLYAMSRAPIHKFLA